MPTKIEWAEESWNPITGCTPISEGCTHCYAERMAKRLAGRFGYPEKPFQFDVTLHEDKVGEPLHWRKPRMVFVCSMGDLFHENVPFEWIDRVWRRMDATPQHTHMVLTKRPKQLLEYWTYRERRSRADGVPFRNVWLGVTAENQRRLKERWPILQQIPAAIKFLSVEPMLNDVFAAFEQGWSFPDWIIVGGESGTGARPMHPDWVRAAREFALCWGIPFFFKQWGAWVPLAENFDSSELVGFPTDDRHYHQWGHCVSIRAGKKRAGHLLDGQEWRQYPSPL